MQDNQLILSVDDEVDIRNSVKQVLGDAGLLVKTAKDGDDFLKKVDKLKPGLVLLDILMPGLTTKEILIELKKRKNNVKIIFLTVVRLAEVTKVRLLKDNVVGFIEKPFDNRYLVKMVKDALKHK